MDKGSCDVAPIGCLPEAGPGVLRVCAFCRSGAKHMFACEQCTAHVCLACADRVITYVERGPPRASGLVLLCMHCNREPVHVVSETPPTSP